MPKRKSTRSGPLSLHAGGQWFVKRKGRTIYLGRDHAAALKKYRDGQHYYDDGRKPPSEDQRLTIRDLVNQFLAHCESRVESGELTRSTFDAYYRVSAEIIEEFGRGAVVEDLRPTDFGKLRQRLAKGRGLVTLSNRIKRAKVVLLFAQRAELIDSRLRFGKLFDKPSKENLRRERNTRGRRDIPAVDVRRLIDAAGTPARCGILLGIQAGFGPTDCACLPLSAINLTGQWIDFPRPKTGVARRFPLWPETMRAIEACIESRLESKTDQLFISPQTRRGYQSDWFSNQFRLLRDSLGLVGVAYDLRRTFRTVADETLDGPAIDLVMGHADPSIGARYRQGVTDDRLLVVVNHVHAWLYGGRDNG